MTVGMADTVMVTSAGEAAIAGVSLVDNINILLIQVFAALATGGAVVVSQYLGRREADHARTAAKQLLYAVAVVSTVLMVLALVFRQHMLSLIFGQIEPDVMDSALAYFIATALAYPFMSIYNAGAALFRSMGNSRVSMFNSLIVNIINITVNAIGPIATWTPMMLKMGPPPEIIEKINGEFAEKVPMGRSAESDDNIGPALFFASDASGFVTGQIVYPDGGLHCIGG